jgi:Raf kinase inhibitor-like YbhB/YbcL family protein
MAVAAGSLVSASCLSRGIDSTGTPRTFTPSAAPSRGGTAMKLTVSSTAFKNGEPIPKKYTGDGDDLSQPISWSEAPAGTKQWALICDDPDAPTSEPWVHWVIYGIPANARSLPVGVKTDSQLAQPKNATQGKNSWPSGNNIGYRGPAPPKGHGVHHYHFKLYALDSDPMLKAGASKDELLKAIDGHVLGTGELVGTYERK